MLQCEDGGQMRLDNVLYVLKLKANILSLGQFDEHGCRILIEGGFLTIYDQHGRLLVKVKKTLSRLYLLKLNPVLSCMVADDNSELTWTWHKRYGHLNFQSLRRLSSKEIVRGLPKIYTSVYILNRAPSRSLDGATPYEVWIGVKPNVEHFRVFGSLCHVKVLGEKLKKLQDRSKPMVFIGYEVGTKGYKCYDLETGRVYISRDVIFEEKSQWDWRNSNIEKKEGTFYSPNFFDTDEEQIDQEAPLYDYHEDVRSLNDIPDNGQGGHLIREERSPRKFVDLDRI